MAKEFTPEEWAVLKSQFCFDCSALGVACRGQECNSCDYWEPITLPQKTLLSKSYINKALWDTGEPEQFESYGAKLRNLLGPWCNTIEVLKHAKETPELLNILYKNIDDYDKNLAKLIEFSKLPNMEALNIRRTNFSIE